MNERINVMTEKYDGFLIIRTEHRLLTDKQTETFFFPLKNKICNNCESSGLAQSLEKIKEIQQIVVEPYLLKVKTKEKNLPDYLEKNVCSSLKEYIYMRDVLNEISIIENNKNFREFLKKNGLVIQTADKKNLDSNVFCFVTLSMTNEQATKISGAVANILNLDKHIKIMILTPYLKK